MAGLTEYIERQGSSLFLRVDNKEPIPLLLLADALGALSSDYRYATGHDLALVRVQEGSIILQLLDYLDKANDLFDFAKNLSALFKQFTGHKQVPSNRGKKGDKTILAIAKLAAKTGSELEMFRRSKDGETTFVRMSPAIGKDIVDRSEAQRTRAISAPRHLAPMIEKPNAGRDSLEDFLISAAESGLTVDDADVQQVTVLGYREEYQPIDGPQQLFEEA